MALHVRGVVLPDDEVGDLWLVGDRVTFEPVPGAVTVADGGFVLPGLVDAHCHIGIAPGGAPDRVGRRGPGAGAASTGTPGCWPSATPARRTRTPSSTTTRTCRGWPGPAGTSRRRKRYLRDIGVEVERGGRRRRR